MFVAIQRWVAVGILGGAFVAGAFGGFVLRATTAKQEASTRGPEPAPRAQIPLAYVAPVAPAPPQAQPPIVVKVITESRPAPVAHAPVRPAANPPPKAAPAKPAVPTERPAALGTPDVKPEPTPGHFYKVQAGDTLHEVSVKAYGGIKRLGDLIHANPALDPNKIRIGALVYVPAGTEPVPAGPGEGAKAPAAAKDAKEKEAVPAAPAPTGPASPPVSPAVAEESLSPRKCG
jgi:hypothetical protein